MNPQPIHALKGLGLGLLCLMVSACDTAPTQVDRHFGMAVRQAQMQQTHKPQPQGCAHAGQGAGCAMHAQHHQPGGMHDKMKDMMPAPMPMAPAMHERHHPSVSTDGVSAQSAIERYQESFQTPPSPTPVFNIGVGATRTR